MAIPPGPRYILSSLPPLSLPILLVYIASFLCQTQGIVIPKWVLVLSYLGAIPAAFTIVVNFRDLKNLYVARSLGATLAPRLGDPTPGGIRTLRTMISGMASGYPANFDERVKTFGYTFNLRVLFQDRYFTMEPQNIKAMLATQFDDFEKGPEVRGVLRGLLGTGVFNADGDMWKFHRSMTRPFFSKDRTSHFDIFDRHTDEAIRKMKQRFTEGHPVDFQDVVARFTLDSASEYLFGKDICSLAGTLPYPYYSANAGATDEVTNQFAKAFNQAQHLSALRMRFGSPWPLFEFWKDRTKEPMATVRQVLDPILKEAVQNKKLRDAAEGAEKKGIAAEESETLLEYLVNYTDDYDVLRDEILNLGVAGRDTTASTLTFATYMLAEHPEVFRRVREEVLTKVGPSRRPTFDDFKEMRFLKAVINETLRLYPPVPFNIRASKSGTLFPARPNVPAFYVPPNTRVAYSVLMMQRRADLWGPDVLEFDPDRFLDERLHRYLTPNPFIFLPFNAGPRICLGQQFAYNETSFFLVRLLQNFSSVSLALDARPPSARPPASWKQEGGIKAREKIKIGSHLTMYVMEGLWVNMQATD
ncbi:cytochrome P450 [Mycena floridula]|nr:cytochrome P450 [Mycena floridula]